jgi:tetratricopeptide (TPR) repeat protein
MRRLVTILALAIAAAGAPVLAAPLAAQKAAKPIPRPKLRDVTDTNDAQAYFEAGLRTFSEDPGAAADAFYWASRLNPGWADPLYARRVAVLSSRQTLLNAIMTSNRRDRPELRSLDSLLAHAYMLNPFLYRRLDRQLFLNWLTNGNRQAQNELTYEINVMINRAPPATQAWFAYSQGNFDRALKHYALAIERARETADLHLERARILGMRNEVEPAVAEFQLALAEMRQKDEKKLVVLYDSKAMAEFSIATLLEGAGQREKAKEAYGRALQEDLAYYPAHMRIGLLALGQGDTAAALSELAMAAELATTDPFVRYLNGWVLGKAKRAKEAVAELTKATELEPYYALPNLVLGTQYEVLEKAPEAIAAYDRFLRTASANDPQRRFATERLEDLKAFVNAPKTQ